MAPISAHMAQALAGRLSEVLFKGWDCGSCTHTARHAPRSASSTVVHWVKTVASELGPHSRRSTMAMPHCSARLRTTVVEHELRRRGGQRHFGCVPSGSAPCGATQNYVKLAGFTDHLHDTDLAPGVTGPCGLSACPRGVKRTNPSRSALHVLRRQSPAAWEV